MVGLENWDEIRTAYQVARMGTVSGAAEVLGVHHATVIRHIDALEKRLGARLFQRHARGYTATESGRDLLLVAQATEEQRRRVADVWLDNSGTAGHLVEQARELWHQRILPFAHNLATGRPTPDPDGLVPADPSWTEQAERIRARLNTACGHRALRIDHIGSTAVTGMDARDIIDIQVSVATPELADELADHLLGAGYLRVGSVTVDRSLDGSKALWPKRLHASADPGRPTHVHIRPEGSPNQRFALLFVDWLNANPGVRADYLDAKRDGRTAAWILDAYGRAESWAQGTDWSPRQVSWPCWLT